jgi:hypothetical protein
LFSNSLQKRQLFSDIADNNFGSFYDKAIENSTNKAFLRFYERKNVQKVVEMCVPLLAPVLRRAATSRDTRTKLKYGSHE